MHDGNESKKKAKTSRLTKELLETAHDMHKSGLLTMAARDKITMRHLGASDIPAAATAQITGADIKAIREEANLSQAVFARYLNVTAGYVSQLERGDKHPSGPALVLLNVIRRKGIGAIL
ncbi:MAG TPA: helix-turn-helix domain-containing protein [Bradyrhizobium sp.]|uniref:helix-turn-helix domain-containing protein n=1 Tax=Bradyrhizobium sp. TaxID=376 RepID=UPI002B5EDDAF|nr:helix-turn-helix domain-containing protein [Bradyrhizobium sp.]HLZ00757.1 helix-turn-helix domain-containing protein [Bradyrhizobium sp.]